MSLASSMYLRHLHCGIVAYASFGRLSLHLIKWHNNTPDLSLNLSSIWNLRKLFFYSASSSQLGSESGAFFQLIRTSSYLTLLYLHWCLGVITDSTSLVSCIGISIAMISCNLLLASHCTFKLKFSACNKCIFPNYEINFPALLYVI